MAEFFHCHQIAYLYGPEFCHFSDVIPVQIHEHIVLRPLFLVVHELAGKLSVFFQVCTTPNSSRKRPCRHFTVPKRKQKLRRCSYYLASSKLQVIHKRRWIYLAQPFVDFQRVACNLVFCFKSNLALECFSFSYFLLHIPNDSRMLLLPKPLVHALCDEGLVPDF